MGQKRQFLGAAVQIGCCLAALLVVAAGRGARSILSVTDGVTIEQITLTPSGYFQNDLLPKADGNVKFVGFKDSPNNPQVGYFTSLYNVTAAPFPPSGANVTVPQSVTQGADGNYWVPYAIQTPNHATVESGVFRVTASYTFSKFAFANPYSCSAFCRSTLGPDGNVWVTELASEKVAKIATSGAIIEYSLPFAHDPSDITAGPDGNLWSVYAKGVDRITPAGTVTSFPNPQASALLQRITQGPDANLYTTDSGTNAIWRLTTSGAWTQYLIPTPGSTPLPIGGLSDGNIWFAEFSAAKIGRLSLTSWTISEFSIPGYSPFQIRESLRASPSAFLLAYDANFDPHPFALSFGVGPTPTPCVPPITIQTFGDNECRVGDSCVVEFEPSGGAYTYSISNTVPGMTFDGARASLEGTPTIPGNYTFTVTVTDSRGCKASLTVTLQVEPARDASLLILEGLRFLGPR